ncbi:hypothetical protein IE53DRAFT_411321 [Violaceomyces palustris]|uniref:Uncharacterized protein n=1 Tax=Violaceomyces palustris TaxID=1673888 RepID=A0ACD0NVQ7_9BASI|nr:hypothetical protein IE53DRAFT_411321 [Violaceomyces palustris]
MPDIKPHPAPHSPELFATKRLPRDDFQVVIEVEDEEEEQEDMTILQLSRMKDSKLEHLNHPPQDPKGIDDLVVTEAPSDDEETGDGSGTDSIRPMVIEPPFNPSQVSSSLTELSSDPSDHVARVDKDLDPETTGTSYVSRRASAEGGGESASSPSPRRINQGMEVLSEASTSALPPSSSTSISTQDAAAIAAAQASMPPPSPPRRALRARKAAQLNPYTIEAIRYQRALRKNDWEDAVVSQREWARQEKRRVREEAEKASAEEGGESLNQWLVPDPEEEQERDSFEESRLRKEEEKRLNQQRKAERRAARIKLREELRKAAMVEEEEEGEEKGQRQRQGGRVGDVAGMQKDLDLVKMFAPFGGMLDTESEASEEGEGGREGGGLDISSQDWPRLPTRNGTLPSAVTYGRRSKAKDKEAISLRNQSIGYPVMDVDMPDLDQDSPPPPPSIGSASSSSVRMGENRKEGGVTPLQASSYALDNDDGNDDDEESLRPRRLQPPSSRPLPILISSEESSPEDERSEGRPTSMTPTQRKRMKSKHRDRDHRQRARSGSSSDSTDYEKRFRQLKHMMPAGMARKYIEDLRAMRHGKAYHSDGHISSTPEPSQASGSEGEFDGDDTRLGMMGTRNGSTPSTSPPEAGELRPGEARKRMRRRSSVDGEGNVASSRFLLLDNTDSESSSSPSPGPESVADDTGSGSDGDRDGDIRWWAWPTSPRRPFRERDAIDRMLSRTNGERKGTFSTKRKKGGRMDSPAFFRQSRIDDHLTERPHGPGKVAKSGPLREVSNVNGNQDEISQRGGPFRAPQKRKRKNHHGDHHRSRRTAGLGPVRRRSNPPVIIPRTRPRLDLVDDDILFDFQMDRDDRRDDRPEATIRNQSKMGAESSRAEERGFRRTASSGRPEQQQQQQQQQHRFSSPPRSPGILGRVQGAATTTAQTPQQPQRYIHRHLHQQGSSPAAVAAVVQQNSPKIGAVTPTSPDQVAAQRIEAESWDDYQGLRLDFGIQPPSAGFSFASSTYIGRGRLFELLNLSKESWGPSNWVHRGTCHALGFELKPLMSSTDILGILPSIFDSIHRNALSAVDEYDLPKGPGYGQSGIEEVLRFLSTWFTWCAGSGTETKSDQDRFLRSIQQQLELLLARVSDPSPCGDRCSAPFGEKALLALKWFNIEIRWRALMLGDRQDEPSSFADDTHGVDSFQEACSSLMMSLLRHGLNKTMRSVKETLSAASRTEREPVSITEEESLEVVPDQYPTLHLIDPTAEMWVCLIHLLSKASTSVNELGPDFSFWTVFESSVLAWQRRGSGRKALIVSECWWYCIFSICSLSHFSAPTGTTSSKPHLREHWPIVSRAISALRFRLDESVEKGMSIPALFKRDQYIRVVLERCSNLTSLWGWKMENAEATLARIFEIFDSHKLSDLPCETDHDFPPFLREYDEKLLLDDEDDEGGGGGGGRKEETAFHLFIKLLARAGRDLRESSKDQKEGDRKVLRLFSRISPVRVMPFTKGDRPPTLNQRSMLFNHYSITMLNLHLVPSAWSSRLRQIKSFLPFKDADFLSQVTCIRAMMYAAVIFRHHGLEIEPITTWFAEVLVTLLKEYEALEKLTGSQQHHQRRKDGKGSERAAAATSLVGERSDDRQRRSLLLRRQGEVGKLIIAVLRSLQHVVDHPKLVKLTAEESRRIYPDLNLLHKAWTKDILEAQLAIDPSIGQEALRLIQKFLVQRNLAIESRRVGRGKNHHHEVVNRGGGGGAGGAGTGGGLPAKTIGEDSQDSFSELFNDDDFDFLDENLVVQQQGEGEDATIKGLDKEFAEKLKTTISTSLFQLVSNIYHPDRKKEGKWISLGSFNPSTHPPPLGDIDMEGQGGVERMLKEAERRKMLQLVIDCWAGCCNVMVENGLRGWESWIVYGVECWKNIPDNLGRWEVGLRFCQNVAVLDPERVVEASGGDAMKDEIGNEFLSVWFQNVVSRSVSIQNLFTITVVRMAEARGLDLFKGVMEIIRGGGGVGDGFGKQGDAASFSSTTCAKQEARQGRTEGGEERFTIQDFVRKRGRILKKVFSNVRDMIEGSGGQGGTSDTRSRGRGATSSQPSRSLLFSCLSAMMASIKHNLEDLLVQADEVVVEVVATTNKSRQDYLDLLGEILHDLETSAAGTEIARGLALSLKVTASLMAKF